MITHANYLETIQKIGVRNLPQPLQESHNVILSRTNEGKDWKPCKEDPELKGMTDLVFKKLGQLIHSRQQKGLSGIPKNSSEFLKRFLEMESKTVWKEDIAEFIDDLQRAIQGQKISKKDIHARQIQVIQQLLIDTYNRIGSQVNIRLKDSTRNMMQDALKQKTKAVNRQVRKKRGNSLEGVESPEPIQTAKKPGIMCSTDFVNLKFESIGLKGKWLNLIGDPSKGFTAMVFGKPKMGKSYLCVDFAGYLARNHGKVLYVAKEEQLDATLQLKLKDKEVAHSNLFVSDHLPENLSDYDFIFLDSVNKLGLSAKDLAALEATNPEKSFIFVFQSTKTGNFRGNNEFQHDVDVVIEVPEQGRAVQFGRFNQGGEMGIFNENTPTLSGLEGLNGNPLLYVIDLNERGSFRAHVKSCNGKVVYEILAGNELAEGETSLFEDGYMKNTSDTDGLESYLKDLKIIGSNDWLTTDSEDLQGLKRNVKLPVINSKHMKTNKKAKPAPAKASARKPVAKPSASKKAGPKSKPETNWATDNNYDKQDQDDLKEVKRLFETGKRAEALRYASQLDTIIREAIPPEVWKAIGGKLTPYGEEKLFKNQKKKYDFSAYDSGDDELNPRYLFNLTSTKLLCELLKQGFDLEYLVREQLANRGVDEEGKWVGFNNKPLNL